MRTPLTSIQGFAQLALHHPDRPAAQRREGDQQIVGNAERMNLFVDDLLLLARLEIEPESRDSRWTCCPWPLTRSAVAVRATRTR
ncbi:histidine kinase dimerization/phospho-acceptor domain-containing protein [Streptomyces sp. NPDC055681]